MGDADVTNVRRLPAGVAAGHPATAQAGLETLAAGGSAADAAVAAALASGVAETIMTGLLGGGHALYWDAERAEARALDCFVAVPGRGGVRPATALVELHVPFGTELVHYAVGPASCGVPGLPAGLEELWRTHGRLPWPRLVEPALRLARAGVPLPPTHAACLEMLEAVMTMNDGAGIFAPEGRLLAAGEAPRQPGLATALELVAAEGAETFYRGTIAERLLALMDEKGGLVTPEDLATFRPRWSAPVEVDYAGMQVLTRGGLAGLAEVLAALPPLAEAAPLERARALVHALGRRPAGGPTHTTNLVTVDRAGNACVLTSSLGLGSGDFLPGLDLHLNSMLGETDLVREPLAPGERMESMMAPTIVLDPDGRLALAAGAAGGTRLRTALVAVLTGVLEERLPPRAAIERPRLHPVGGTVHAEPGVDEAALRGLEADGWKVRRWPSVHHYFGGASAVGEAGAAGDPRRSGAGATLP
jgi:gamma-glutamyltranspeptidase / glutathione hydrolase